MPLTMYGININASEIYAAIPLLNGVLPEYAVFPGFCDVHVHFREPGFSYKETIASGCLAAASGGYTAVCTMPNLEPAPDCAVNLKVQTDIIGKDAVINVYPYGTITKSRLGKELSEMAEISDTVIAFSDDGSGVQDEATMKYAMQIAKSMGKIIAAHCEDNSLLNGGCIHDGAYSLKHGFKGIPSASEYKQLERDLFLAKKIGVKYHVCHISTAESVDLIRKAKKEGVDVTCETAPHYLTLDESNLADDGRFKMNPPLRSKNDRLALIDGISDGTIDMIATDHAPHSDSEKNKGLVGSAFGIVGLETAFPVLYTYLVKEKVISLEKLIDLLAVNPRKRFNIPLLNDYCIWDLNRAFIVDSKDFKTKGNSSPYIGDKLYGKCMATFCNGRVVVNNIKE